MNCSKFVSLCNPCANYDALENFKTLQTRKQIAIGAITGVVAVLTLPVFGLLGVLTFRCLVKKFSAKKIELDGEDKKVQNIVQEKMDPAQKLELLKQRKASLLIHAIVENNIEKVKGLLNEADIPDSEGYLPFHWAIQEGHLEIVELLMDKVKPEAINAEISNGIYPLTLCVKENHPNIAKYLLEHGASPDIPYNNKSIWLAIAETGQLELVRIFMEKRSSEEKWRALSYAAEQGRIDVMEYLLDSGAAALEIDEGHAFALDDNQELIIWTYLKIAPLFRAAQVGNLESVKFLIEKEPELLNYKMDNEVFGFTVLTHAVKHGKMNVVEYLLKQGADPSITDQSNNLPLHHAADKRHLEIAKMLIEKKADTINVKGYVGATPLCVASSAGNLDMFQFLLNKGADANILDDNGYLPLHWACRKGYLKMIELLIDKKFNINAKGDRGFTALHHAAEHGHLEIVKILIDKGANINIPTSEGRFPIQFAAYNGHLDILKHLLEIIKDVNFKDDETNATLLMCASMGDKDNVVKYLMDQGADITIMDIDGKVPLHYATYNGHLNVIKLLIESKPELINAPTLQGETALHIATKTGQTEVVKYLLSKRADNNLQDKNHKTAKLIAEREGFEEIFKLLDE